MFDALAAAASLAGTIFGATRGTPSSKAYMPDISGELAKLDALYDEQSKRVASQVDVEGMALKKSAVEDLAARGIFSSPVSEQTLIRTNQTIAQAKADAEARLRAAQIDARTSLTSKLMDYASRAAEMQNQYDWKAYETESKNISSLLGGVGGVFGSLSDYYKKPQTAKAV